MGLYKKKPITIEAIQFTGDNSNEILSWATRFSLEDPVTLGLSGDLLVETIEGTMRAKPGWWIIKGIKGEFYPCDPVVFDASYDPV